MKNSFFKKTLALAAATMTILTTQLTGFAVTDTTPPTAPTNLTASNIEAGQVTLSWTPSTDNVGVWGYAVYNGSTLIDSRLITQDDTTTWVIDGLYAQSTYSFTVEAYDTSSNFSAPSNSVLVTTPIDVQAPTVPGNLRCYARSGTSFGLTWNYSTDNVAVSNYHLYGYKDGQRMPLSTDVYTSGTTQTVELEPYHSYAFYVTARDIYGNESAASNAYVIPLSLW